MENVLEYIKQPKHQDLADPKVYDWWLNALAENVVQFRTYEARIMTDALTAWLQQHSEFAVQVPNQYTRLQSVMIDNQWIALRMLPKEQTINLFAKHLMALFTMPKRYTFPWDASFIPTDTLHVELRSNLLQYADYDERDEVKSRISIALEHNQEVITSEPFFIEIKSMPATLERWFAAYIESSGPNRKESEFNLSQFLHKSENGSKLSEESRNRLATLFKLYHLIQRSSYTVEGIEEKFSFDSGDKLGVIQYGEVELYDKDTMQTIRQAQLLGDEREATARPPVQAIHTKSSPVGSVPTVTGPDIEATKGPDHFSEQDEREITQTANGLGKVERNGEVYTAKAQALVNNLGLSFASQDQDKRFTDLVASVLRGLRDVMELKTYLIDLQFPSSEIDAVLAAIQQERGQTGAVDGQPVFRKLAAKPTLAQLQKQQANEPTKPTTPVAEVTSVQTVSATSTTPRRSFLPKLRRTRAQKRQIVDDVKLQPTMVMGPIDELRAMDTVEFRRLSPDPYQAAARLKDKIELLGEESVAKQAEGVDAFKQSSLNKLYLELGNNSMSSNRPVADVIAEHEQKGIPTLSVTEFAAIADLNKQIRF